MNKFDNEVSARTTVLSGAIGVLCSFFLKQEGMNVPVEVTGAIGIVAGFLYDLFLFKMVKVNK